MSFPLSSSPSPYQSPPLSSPHSLLPNAPAFTTDSPVLPFPSLLHISLPTLLVFTPNAYSDLLPHPPPSPPHSPLTLSPSPLPLPVPLSSPLPAGIQNSSDKTHLRFTLFAVSWHREIEWAGLLSLLGRCQPCQISLSVCLPVSVPLLLPFSPAPSPFSVLLPPPSSPSSLSPLLPFFSSFLLPSFSLPHFVFGFSFGSSGTRVSNLSLQVS